MSAFSGKQGKGAMKERRKQKVRDAAARNLATRPDRTKRYRRVMNHVAEVLREDK